MESWRRSRGLYLTMGYIGILIYDRKRVVIFRTANLFLVLEEMYTYTKHIHPDFGTETCNFRSERKQTRSKREQLSGCVAVCPCTWPCCRACCFSRFLAHGIPFLRLSSSPLFLLAPQANVDSSLPIVQQGCDTMILSTTTI